MTTPIETRSRLEDAYDDLAAENRRLLARAQGQEEEIVKLMAWNERLQDALRPFADAWIDWTRCTDIDSPVYVPGDLSATDVIPTTMEPYRKAAEALGMEQPE